MPAQTREFEIPDLFDVRRDKCPPLKHLSYGETPIVTASEKSNRIAGYYKVPDESIVSDCITIAANGSVAAEKALWHPYPCAAVPDALIRT